MEPIIDHIQITVKDMTTAVPFYDKLLPLFGFDIRNKVSAVIEDHEFHVVEYTHPRLIFAITSPRSVFADETINRVAKKLDRGEEFRDLYTYVYGVARMLVLEIQKESAKQRAAFDYLPSPEPAGT